MLAPNTCFLGIPASAFVAAFSIVALVLGILFVEVVLVSINESFFYSKRGHILLQKFLHRPLRKEIAHDLQVGVLE